MPRGWYADPDRSGMLRWWDGGSWTSFLAPPDAIRVQGELRAPGAIELEEELKSLRSQVIETRDVMMLQEVGLYRYSHPLEDSVAYADALEKLETQIKELVKSGKASSGTKRWAINGSEKEGAKMITDMSKLMLRAYNSEADSVLRSMQPFKLDAAKQRLEKMREAIASLGKSMQLQISDEFHALRQRELELTADFLQKKEEEKDREREERARLKEEEIARREIEREQARLEKERQHYLSAIQAVDARGDESSKAKLTAQLAEVETALDGVTARAANVRAGYVYVLSNIGSFGERIVKIGLTRRLDPMERVKELGDASVPFRFDVHAIVFSDDAVTLETKLHQRFAEHRVNLVNAHREYFFVTPQQVRDALLEFAGHLLTFHERPDAAEWRQSETTRTSASAKKMPAPLV